MPDLPGVLYDRLLLSWIIATNSLNIGLPDGVLLFQTSTEVPRTVANTPAVNLLLQSDLSSTHHDAFFGSTINAPISALVCCNRGSEFNRLADPSSTGVCCTLPFCMFPV